MSPGGMSCLYSLHVIQLTSATDSIHSFSGFNFEAALHLSANVFLVFSFLSSRISVCLCVDWVISNVITKSSQTERLFSSPPWNLIKILLIWSIGLKFICHQLDEINLSHSGTLWMSTGNECVYTYIYVCMYEVFDGNSLWPRVWCQSMPHNLWSLSLLWLSFYCVCSCAGRSVVLCECSAKKKRERERDL